MEAIRAIMATSLRGVKYAEQRQSTLNVSSRRFLAEVEALAYIASLHRNVTIYEERSLGHPKWLPSKPRDLLMSLEGTRSGGPRRPLSTVKAHHPIKLGSR